MFNAPYLPPAIKKNYYSWGFSQDPCAKDNVCHSYFLWVPLLLGSTWQEKVSTIRSYMQNHTMAPTGVLLSALDETACEWGFVNMSGSGSPKPPGPCDIEIFLK